MVERFVLPGYSPNTKVFFELFINFVSWYGQYIQLHTALCQNIGPHVLKYFLAISLLYLLLNMTLFAFFKLCITIIFVT